MSHSRKFCKNDEKCLTCNELRHPEGDNCPKSPKFANGSGPHRSLDKSCPEVMKAKKINEIMATDNISFFEAIKSFVNIGAASPGANNFPPLKSRQNKQNQVPTDRNKKTENAWNSPINVESHGKSQEDVNHIIRVDNKKDLIKLPIDMVRLLQELPNIPEVEELWKRIWSTFRSHCIIKEAESKKKMIINKKINTPTKEQGKEKKRVKDG